MAISDPELQRLLHALVRHLEPAPGWHDDLMQEALLHCWCMHQQRPGQLPAWYVQGCRFHLLNYLRRGRSVDSTRHASLQMWPVSAGLDDDTCLELPQGENVWHEISANDLIATLSLWLTQDEQAALHCLADGLSARETALRLNCSHTLVNRWRQRIATVAIHLGVESSAKATLGKSSAASLSEPRATSVPGPKIQETHAP
jgi:DNA-directed RNA polymerase specialized sigma24 family protein